MQNLKPSVRKVSRHNIPDYVGDKASAIVLAKNIQNYYHSKGQSKVRCWVEPELIARNKKLWGVRSNIVFVVPSPAR